MASSALNAAFIKPAAASPIEMMSDAELSPRLTHRLLELATQEAKSLSDGDNAHGVGAESRVSCSEVLRWMAREPMKSADIRSLYLAFDEGKDPDYSIDQPSYALPNPWKPRLVPEPVLSCAQLLLPPLSPVWHEFIDMLFRPSWEDKSGDYRFLVGNNEPVGRSLFTSSQHHAWFCYNNYWSLWGGDMDRRYYEARYAGAVFAVHALQCAVGFPNEPCWPGLGYVDSVYSLDSANQVGNGQDARLRAALGAAYISSYYATHHRILDANLCNGFSCWSEDFNDLVVTPCCAWLRVRAAAGVLQRRWRVARYDPSYVLCCRFLAREHADLAGAFVRHRLAQKASGR